MISWSQFLQAAPLDPRYVSTCLSDCMQTDSILCLRWEDVRCGKPTAHQDLQEEHVPQADGRFVEGVICISERESDGPDPLALI